MFKIFASKWDFTFSAKASPCCEIPPNKTYALGSEKQAKSAKDEPKISAVNSTISAEKSSPSSAKSNTCLAVGFSIFNSW